MQANAICEQHKKEQDAMKGGDKSEKKVMREESSVIARLVERMRGKRGGR